MKTIRFSFLGVATTSAVLLAGEPTPLDAAHLPPAKTAVCCTADVPAARLPADLSARSLYQVDATWTNDVGEAVQLRALRGRPVVIAMFFAHCEYACPLIVGDLKRLRDSLPQIVREKTAVILVSFDSDRDTVAALHAYRERAALDSSWTLLRGGASDVRELAMLLGVKYKQDARGQFSHSNLITVLSLQGEIVHQRAGLTGDVSEAAKAVELAAEEKI